MKVVIACLAFLLLLIPLAGAAPIDSAAHARGTIRITGTVADVRSSFDPEETGSRRVSYLRLWNRQIRGTPIGYAVISCAYLGDGGPFGSGLSSCGATYRLPRGYIMASGLRHKVGSYTFAVTGGTGIYKGVGGVVVSRVQDIAVRALLFQLQ